MNQHSQPAVFQCWFEPPHFVMGHVGVTARRVTLDSSTAVTPDPVLVRGQSASLGIKDLLPGSPFGLQLEASTAKELTSPDFVALPGQELGLEARLPDEDDKPLGLGMTTFVFVDSRPSRAPTSTCSSAPFVG